MVGSGVTSSSGPTEFDAFVRRVGEVWVVDLVGQVDYSTAERMESAFAAFAETDRPKVVVNMQKLVFISSIGWGILLNRTKHVASRHGSMCIAGMPPAIRHVFELLGLSSHLQQFATEPEALAALR